MKTEQGKIKKIIFCPECKRDMPEGDIFNKWCCQCGYVLEGREITIGRGDYIHIRDWEFTDRNNKTHKIVALQVNNQIFHYGKDGLKTNIKERSEI